MKNINKFLCTIAVAASAVSYSSCVGDLDLTPTDPSIITAGIFGSDPEAYLNGVLADVYFQFATYGVNGNAAVQGFDGGMSTFQRAIFNLEEIPSDEANWLPTDDADFATLQYGYIAATNKAVMGTYSRLLINIALCNDFIQTVNKGYFKLPDELKEKAQAYCDQCRILRSACYFYMISLFGNVPYADENVSVGEVAPQLSSTEIYKRVVATLEEVSARYDSYNVAPAYGYIGKDACDAFLVKFYLNAEVFTNNEISAFDKCWAKAKEIIDRHQGAGFNDSGLADHYIQLFAANNQQYGPAGSNAVQEILWAIPSSETNLKNYAGSTLLIEGWITDTGVQETMKEPKKEDYKDDQSAYEEAMKEYTKADAWKKKVDYTYAGTDYSYDPNAKYHIANAWYNANSSWKCMSTRTQFVNKFDWNDNEKSQSDDKRVALWCTSAQGFNIDNTMLTQPYYGDNGYIAVKFTNFNIADDGTVDEANVPVKYDCCYADYPVVRLAEIYLSAAEAYVATTGVGNATDAVKYVNYVRERAGLQPWTAGDLNYESLQDERCRELYQENCRRTDLIRYGKWLSGYTWNWKGGVKAGTDLPSNSRYYPLPADVVTMAGYTQNPGY